jgi:hypothetical protein
LAEPLARDFKAPFIKRVSKMPHSTIKETEALIAERICRVTLDCKIQINEITPEALRKSGYRDGRGQESALRDANRQSGLLHAMLRDAQTLDRFLTYVIVNDFGILVDAELEVRFSVQEEDAILKRVYSVVGGDKVYFADEDQGSDAPVEDTELLHACFKVDWRGTVLRGIELVPGGADPEGVKR